MTVFHLISSEGYYGAEAMLLALARSSSELGCKNVVGVFRDFRRAHTEIADRARGVGLAVETIPCSGRWDWKVVRLLQELLGEHKVDVLHTHGYKADFYGYTAAWANRAALLSTCHNWPSKQPLMRAYAGLDRLVLRGFDRVVAVSDSVAGILRRSGLAAEKMAVIPNGVDVQYFAGPPPTLHLERAWERKRLVGFVGRLVECKGGAVLLHAAQKVLAAYPDALFVLVGEGPLHSEWEAMAVRLGIAESVVFLGARTDMPGIYASLGMLVLPSRDEATPMCVLEGLAAGKPVIATRVGAVPKLITSGVTGILVEAGDVSGLANAVLRLLRDPELARRLGENGHLHVVRHFSAGSMAAHYLGQYAQALAARPRQRERLACFLNRT